MKFSVLQTFALSRPEVTQAPHHHMNPFWVAGKIFVTVVPDQSHIHVFLAEPRREQALALYPPYAEKLFRGSKVAGLRVSPGKAPAGWVKPVVRQAWANKAPKRLLTDESQS